MFCPNCGSKIDDDAQFCYQCGSKITRRDERTEQASAAGAEAIPPTNQSPYNTVSGYTAQNYSSFNMQPAAEPRKEDDRNVIALIGFILSFFASVPAIVCSAIGLKNAQNNGGVKYGFAKAGLIIGIVNTAVSIVLSIVIIITANALLYHYLGIYHEWEQTGELVMQALSIL